MRTKTIAREDVRPDVVRYEVRGTLDADTSQAMRDAEREPPPDSVVVIDLAKCSGMDDFGFGSLVGLIRRAREHDARVQLTHADDTLRDELRRTGVARLVEIVDEPVGDTVPAQ
jgi:anti-anti-sigma factor